MCSGGVRRNPGEGCHDEFRHKAQSRHGADFVVERESVRTQAYMVVLRSTLSPILRYSVAIETPSMLAVFSREPLLYLSVS